MDQIVTLETARLAEEIGFDGKVLHFYNHGENELIPITILISPPTPISVEHLETSRATLPVDHVPAPTQTALSKWLREKHDIYTEIYPTRYGFMWKLDSITDEFILGCKEGPSENDRWDIYEECLEDALKEACKIVKERRS